LILLGAAAILYMPSAQPKTQASESSAETKSTDKTDASEEEKKVVDAEAAKNRTATL